MGILWLLLTILLLSVAYYFIFRPNWEFFEINRGVRGNNYGALCDSNADCVPFFKCRMNGDVKKCM